MPSQMTSRPDTFSHFLDAAEASSDLLVKLCNESASLSHSLIADRNNSKIVPSPFLVASMDKALSAIGEYNDTSIFQERYRQSVVSSNIIDYSDTLRDLAVIQNVMRNVIDEIDEMSCNNKDTFRVNLLDNAEESTLWKELIRNHYALSMRVIRTCQEDVMSKFDGITDHQCKIVALASLQASLSRLLQFKE